MDFPRTLFFLFEKSSFHLTLSRYTELLLQAPTVLLLKVFKNSISLNFYLAFIEFIYFSQVIIAIYFCRKVKDHYPSFSTYIVFAAIFSFSMTFALAGSHLTTCLSLFWIYIALEVQQSKYQKVKYVLLTLICVSYEGSLILLIPLILFQLIHYFRNRTKENIIKLLYSVGLSVFMILHLIYLKNSKQEIVTTFTQLLGFPLFTFSYACLILILLWLKTVFKINMKYIYRVTSILFLIIGTYFLYSAYLNDLMSPWEYYKAKPYALILTSILCIPVLFKNSFKFSPLDNRFIVSSICIILILLIPIELKLNLRWRDYLDEVRYYKTRNGPCAIFSYKKIKRWDGSGNSVTNLPHLSILLQKTWSPDYVIYPQSFNNENPCTQKKIKINGKDHTAIGYHFHQWKDEIPESQSGRFIKLNKYGVFKFNKLFRDNFE